MRVENVFVVRVAPTVSMDKIRGMCGNLALTLVATNGKIAALQLKNIAGRKNTELKLGKSGYFTQVDFTKFFRVEN